MTASWRVRPSPSDRWPRCGACQQALQTAADGVDKSLPGLVAGLVILAADPATDDTGEQVLEGGTVILRVAQDFQCAWLIRQHGRQQAADHRLGVEFVEGRIDFQFRRAHAGSHAALQG